MNLKALRIAIIIPTFKELENITILTKRIIAIFPKAKIIIVDDSPIEDNRKLQNTFKKNNPNIRIISRLKKDGRGSAVILGFKEALKYKTIDYFFEMDADLAHNPKEITSFLKKRNDADLIIGSRYLTGSKINSWPLKRLILSKAINFFLRIWLGLNLSDYTNGFRMYNRKSLEFLCVLPLKEKGFIALSEIAFKLKKAGFKISEVPITFTDRRFGKSNAGIRELLSSFIGVIRIPNS